MLNGLTLPPPTSVLAMAVFVARLRGRAAQATLTPLPPAELSIDEFTLDAYE